jgi:hypothetical protein
VDLALACPSLAPTVDSLSCPVPFSTWTWIPLAWIAFTVPLYLRRVGCLAWIVNLQLQLPPNSITRGPLPREKPSRDGDRPLPAITFPLVPPHPRSVDELRPQGERFAILLSRPPCPTAPLEPKLANSDTTLCLGRIHTPIPHHLFHRNDEHYLREYSQRQYTTDGYRSRNTYLKLTGTHSIGVD